MKYMYMYMQVLYKSTIYYLMAAQWLYSLH